MKRWPISRGTMRQLLAATLAIAPIALNAAAPKVREPAVAGLFYPKDAGELTRMIDGYLAAAKAQPSAGKLKALICPHAGYAYSGPVAASGFRLLQGVHFETVVVLAPSHYAALDVASVSDADVFRTPLGDVPISSAKARRLAQLSPFALEPRCAMQRPGWAAQSSRQPPADGRDTAATWEHADEVEVPFLQRTLKNFQLLPVVFGDVDPAKAARALMQILDDRTLIVASSDLSHYHSYAEACALDRRCTDAICALDVSKISGEDACGYMPILTLLHVAKQQGWQAKLLDYRNSGDTAGDKSRVVGYAAIAFYTPTAAAETFTKDQRRFLLELARQSVREATATGRLPPKSADGLAAKLTEPKGCFVTLTKGGMLRGCIGHITPQLPLYQAIAENARSAAIRDPRFLPVSAREVAELEIEISVLTVPQSLAFASPDDLLRKLRPHEDGVVLQIGGRGATYLPQVWEHLPDKVEFLSSLAEKAGCAPGDWRKPGAAVSIYHVESFKESDR
jgi:hypothetical protein